MKAFAVGFFRGGAGFRLDGTRAFERVAMSGGF
jgi:hypothetical protein